MRRTVVAVLALLLCAAAPASAHHTKPGAGKAAKQPDKGYLHKAEAGRYAMARWEIPFAEKIVAQVKLGPCDRIHRRLVHCKLLGRGGKCVATVKVHLYLVNWKGNKDRHLHAGEGKPLRYRCAR